MGPLPFAMTPLIGREAEVAAIAGRLTSPAIRLLTLIGPGGIGKTRLALAAAHAVRQFYADGAHLLRFAAVTDPSLVPVTLARALDVRGSPDDPDAWAIARNRRCQELLEIIDRQHTVRWTSDRRPEHIPSSTIKERKGTLEQLQRPFDNRRFTRCGIVAEG